MVHITAIVLGIILPDYAILLCMAAIRIRKSDARAGVFIGNQITADEEAIVLHIILRLSSNDLETVHLLILTEVVCPDAASFSLVVSDHAGEILCKSICAVGHASHFRNRRCMFKRIIRQCILLCFRHAFAKCAFAQCLVHEFREFRQFSFILIRFIQDVINRGILRDLIDI